MQSKSMACALLWLSTSLAAAQRSDAVESTSDPTLHGVTRPVVLTGSFNGGYAGHPMDPHARAGFSAHGTIKRSEYGVSFGVPAPGTHFGVGDDIDVSIETELSGPPLAAH
jgi:polyisoprenoid-binding protein YceI